MGSTLGSTRTLSKHPFSAQKGRRLVNVTRYRWVRRIIPGIRWERFISGRLNRLERYRYFALHPKVSRCFGLTSTAAAWTAFVGRKVSPSIVL